MWTLIFPHHEGRAPTYGYFRFKRRMPSRASAVRELLKRGLAAEGFLSAAASAKSSDYGVIGKTPAGSQ